MRDAELRGSPRTSLWWSLGDGLGLFPVVFLAYSLGAALSWVSFGAALGPAFFYPPSGVTVTAMILTRRALWPAVVAAVLAGETIVDITFGNSSLTTLCFIAANAVEPLIGASLALAWCRGTPDLRERRDFVAFIVGAGVIGPVFGALIGGSVTAADIGTDWLGSVLNWWGGDALGVLVVGSPILLWAKQSYIVRQRPWETVTVLAAAAALSIAASVTATPPSMLLLPLLAWAALRLDMLGASLAGAVVALLANIMTTHGRGLFTTMGLTLSARIILTQVFIAVVVVVAMLIAQEAAGRLAAVREREVERRERIRLETLSRLAQQLAAALTPQEVGRALAHQVLNEAGAKAVNLGLLSADGRNLEWVVMSGHPKAVVDEFAGGVSLNERAVATDAVRTGQPIVVRTSAEYAHKYPENVHWLRLSSAETTVGWPLEAGGKPFGVLLMMWSEPQPFDDAQRAYTSAVATILGQALVRARAYADEHARAAVLQSAVLPTTPADTGELDVFVAYEPADVAQGLGGDWYDVMLLPNSRVYVAVGDVVGHGLPAVEDMAQLRSAGRAFAHQGLSPAQLLAELNGFTRHVSNGKFATMAVAILEPAAGRLSYCVAGHPPPFLRYAADGRVMCLGDARGPVLGPIENANYNDESVAVSPGDVLVMYTDGLVERHGMGIEVGLARAQQMIAGWNGRAALSDCCGVLEDSLSPRPRSDDVCIIAVRFPD